ncbi:GGDEF domain-containing protein [Flexibacterium corallicola]|uniref:GGDEF domain-containing protein n=1 Tax=Flexibacterium corallicola TaxID=3037259 RepID=UPI00286FA719|nr:GGDEF domain-containing protein [Pseudovibrio sp. M1P-2-3]
MSKDENIKRSLVYADSALKHIKTSEIPAFPRNYELWYSYSSGINPNLTRSINKILSETGKLTEEQADSIYNRYLSVDRLSERIDEVGGKVTDKINDLVEILKRSSQKNTLYVDHLETALDKMGTELTQSELKLLTLDLIRITASTLDINRAHQDKLLTARDHLSDLHENLETIRAESLKDELTTLYNRRHFDQTLDRAVQAANEGETPLALLITDIDHFKQFNDNYGHQTGDQVLRLVAMATKQNVTPQDIACRYGGEEFGVILPLTSLTVAQEIAEKIRRAVLSKELIKRSTGENLGRITLSVGVASFRSGDTSQSLIERADAALYQAKGMGRNLVKTELDLPDFGQVA